MKYIDLREYRRSPSPAGVATKPKYQLVALCQGLFYCHAQKAVKML